MKPRSKLLFFRAFAIVAISAILLIVWRWNTPSTDWETAETPSPPQSKEEPIQKSHSAELQSALQCVNEADPKARMSCASTLGEYNEERSNAALLALANDPEQQVRIKAIEALSKNPSQLKPNPREKLLQDLLGRISTEPNFDPERIAAWAGLCEAASTNENREKALEGISSYLLTTRPQSITLAVQNLINVAPRNPMVLEKLRTLLTSQYPPEATVFVLQHFSKSPDLSSSWLPQKLPLLLKSPSPLIRKAAVESLSYLCPPSVNDILEEVLRVERDPEIRFAAEAALARGCINN